MNSDPLAAGPPDDSQSGQPDQATAIDVSGVDATPLCPHCLSEFDQRASFCPQCQAPVGAFATYDPLQQIQSTGWLYRKASQSRIPAFAVLAFWWILGPIVLSGLFGLTWIGRAGELGAARMAYWLIFLCISLLYGALLLRITRNYVRHRRLREGHCQQCAHNLTGLTEPKCPECGTDFNPDAGSDDDESLPAQP